MSSEPYINWRYHPLTVKQWMRNCKSSSHVRPGDKVTFAYSQRTVRALA